MGGQTLSGLENGATAPESVNWCIITGAPCSGKSTVIESLADRGYPVVKEVARAYIDSQLASGQTLAQIKADRLDFERRILLEKVEIEQNLPAEQQTFLDRAVPDSIAYFKLEGLDPAEALHHSRARRYKRIFLFERLLFEKDRVRSEDHAMAEHLESLITAAYTGLGYTVVRVPVMAIELRTDFVLAHSPGC